MTKIDRYTTVLVHCLGLIFIGLFSESKCEANDINKCHKGMNVEEAFNSLTSDLLPIIDDEKGRLVDPKIRKKQIALKDLKNGYLELQNKTIIPDTAIVLFRLKGGEPLLVVTEDGISVQRVYAFRCIDKKWVDSVQKYLPSIPYEHLEVLYKKAGVKPKGKALTAKNLEMVAHSRVRYSLPRVGKKLKIFSGHPDYENVLLEERVFNGTEFLPNK